MFLLIVFSTASFAATSRLGETVEIDGDTIEYSVDGSKVIASGNVVARGNRATLYADYIEVSQDEKIAVAEGNVRLVSDQGEVSGEKITYNFGTERGTLENAHIFTHPYYGAGSTVSKVSDNQLIINDGYITTSDYDKPEWRIQSRKIDVYPGDKIVARNVRIVFGNVPFMWLPRFSQRIDDTQPRIIFTPGYDKDWGLFLLSRTRYYINEYIKGTIHVDYRERKDLAWGFDTSYTTKGFGSGIVKTYYMNERSLGVKRFYQERILPTIEKERYKIEWRHNWQVDQKTNAVLQYYLLSDANFLKDYFEREFDDDSAPKTFFLLTRALNYGTFSFQTDWRVNRFTDAVERLPEVKYTLSSQKIGDTNFYFKNESSYVQLTRKSASPSFDRDNTNRMDTDNELSYLMKVGIFEFKPFVGTRYTYYSKTKEKEDYNTIRSIFRTGASVSTKFYRIFDVYSDGLLQLDRLRHIITPIVTYDYQAEPTRGANELDYYDGIDDIDNIHSINFALENKLQTKRNGTSVDLVRAVVSTDFRLKEHPTGPGFDRIRTDIDVKPLDWLTLYFDSEYDTRREYLDTANFDLYINGGDDWRLGIGKRYDRDVDDQLTLSFDWIINPKWKLSLYERYDIDSGIQKEQQYVITRDLHTWETDLMFNETRGEGSEIIMVFRLKAFPEIGADFGSSFNRRKAGTQDSRGE